MKKWLIILGVLLWTSSCFDDKGNYDYTDLGEMSIEGITTDRWYERFAYSDTLKIPVEIHSTRYTNGEEPYTYEWKFIPLNAETKEEGTDELIDYVVSRDKNLNIVPEMEAKDYNGYFVVRDTIMGLQKKVDFFVRLKTMTSEGWMVLCEEDGEARLDWVAPVSENNYIVARNLWEMSDFKLGKPYSIASAYFLRQSNRYVFTENGTFNLDKNDAHVGEDNDVRWQFGDMPDVVHGLATELAIQRGNRLDLLVTRDRDLYVRNPSTVGSIYTYPVNYTSDGKRFDVAPYFGHCYGGTGASVIIYDETNKRFMELDDDNKNVPHLLKFSSEGNVEFSAETGRDMVYMNWTKDSYTFAVLEDPNDGEMYVYGIRVGANNNNERRYYMKLNRPNRDKIKHIAFHSIYRYLFYSTEDAVYQFDMDSPATPAQKVLTFPGETVTALKINKMLAWVVYQPWEKMRENQLVVGTTKNDEEESKCGVMRIYDVPSLMAPLELKNEYRDLGKIVDIVYRERGN